MPRARRSSPPLHEPLRRTAAVAVAVAALIAGAVAAGAQTVRSSFGVILFESGSAEVSELDGAMVADIADWVDDHPYGRIVVEGHASREGALVANLALSERRAQAVADALVDAGIPVGRITVVASGEEEPISEVPALNRRVRIWATTF